MGALQILNALTNPPNSKTSQKMLVNVPITNPGIIKYIIEFNKPKTEFLSRKNHD